MSGLGITVSWNARLKGFLKGMSSECFGICDSMCFVVLRPTGEQDECGGASPSWELGKTVVYMGWSTWDGPEPRLEPFLIGPGDEKEIILTPIEILSIAKGEDVPLPEGVVISEEREVFTDDTLFIKTSKGDLYLPSYCRREEGDTPTFSGKKLSYYHQK